MFFLTAVEIFIAVTGLVSITNDLGGFDQSSWILTSYQLGYVGMLQGPILWIRFTLLTGSTR